MRDIFTMGARPIALADPLRVGPLDDARSNGIAQGIVSGISGYGNSVGVPTVAGEFVSCETYRGNPLVNVAAVGTMPVDRLVLGQATEVGTLAVLMGALTGRDGIGGVSVPASAGFDGGAGLTCATSETASRGGTGMEVNVAAVPLRQSPMESFEIMTSESQERMLAIVSPACVDEVISICACWEVAATVIGRVTDDGLLRIRDSADAAVLACVPAATLHDEAPSYDRPLRRPADLDARRELDPALLRLRDPRTGVFTGRGLGITTDANHRWCHADPRRGTAMVVMESALNLACVGADPLAIVNCLNFGNPTHPEVMRQLSESIDGMSDACNALGVPVVGGNVSLYNETDGSDIAPTPVVCMIGLHPDLAQRPTIADAQPGCELVLLGDAGGSGRSTVPLGGSQWAWERSGCRDGVLPSLDLEGATATARFVASSVRSAMFTAIHDVSDGGIAVALAQMCCHNRLGMQARVPPLAPSAPAVRALFAEPPGRGHVMSESANEPMHSAGVEPTKPREACGVFGVYAPGGPVAYLSYLGLYALQHRGQESAGIAVSDGTHITVVKDMGLAASAFDDRVLAGLDGHLAIGHTRYSRHLAVVPRPPQR